MRIYQRSSTRRHTDNPRIAFFVRVMAYLVFAAVLIAAGYFLGQESPDMLLHPWRSLIAYRQQMMSVPALYLDIPFEAYQRLLSQRDQALQQGANYYSQELEGWGDSELRFDNQTTPIKLRLAPAPASVFAGNYWPLDINCTASNGCLGMQVMQLLPVQDETAISSAALLTSLEQSGAASITYQWVRLFVNGDAWGLFVAYETPLSMPTPVIAMDSSEWLKAPTSSDKLGPTVTYPYGQVVSNVVAFPLDSRFDEAELALQRLMQGDATAISIIDTESWGRYLALRALWCGSPWPDWRTSAWTYDGEHSRLQPVGAPCSDSGDEHALPASFFTDLTVQKSLVQALYDLGADPIYYQNILAQITPFYNAAGSEVTDMPATDLWLAERQTQIIALFSSTPPVLARLSPERALAPDTQALSTTQTSSSRISASQEMLYIDLINLMPVPVEVLGLDVNENGFIPASPAWMDNNTVQDAFVVPAGYGVPVTTTLHIPISEPTLYWDGDIWLSVRVWGVESAESLPQILIKVQAGSR